MSLKVTRTPCHLPLNGPNIFNALCTEVFLRKDIVVTFSEAGPSPPKVIFKRQRHIRFVRAGYELLADDHEGTARLELHYSCSALLEPIDCHCGGYLQ